MGYQDRKMKELFLALAALEDDLDAVYDDILCGEDVMKLTETLNLTSHDTMIIFSLDGAQLYQDKKSDTWIGIWIIINYDPKTWYRKKQCYNFYSFTHSFSLNYTLNLIL